jgi:hypothetical protein
MTVIALPERLDHLAVISLWRRSDGTIEARLEGVSPQAIERIGKEAAGNMRELAQWTQSGARDLLRQATRLEEPL